MPKHFTKNEKDEIRKKLLKSARKLFIKYGFTKTTILDVTKETGIGKGSFYQFYNSKGDIFLEVYQIEREKIRKKLNAMHAEENGDFTIKLEQLIYDLVTILQNNSILRLMYEPGTLDAIMDKAVEKRLAEYNRKTNRALMSVIDSWLEEKTDAADAAIIVGILRAITMLRHHISAIGPEIYKDVIDTLVSFVVHGISEKYKSRALVNHK